MPAKDAFASLFPGYSERDLVVMKTNVSSANYWAVANGAGIGVFPTYALALGGKMIPLDIERAGRSTFGFPIIQAVAASRGYGT